MSEWTPEDAARLAELLAQLRDDQAAVVDDGYEHRCHVASPAQTAALAHALDHIEGLEAKRAHMQRVCVLTREEAEAFCDLRDLFAAAPNAITITCGEDGAIAEIGGKEYPLDPPNPDPRIERAAEWLYEYAQLDGPGVPLSWDEASDQQPFLDNARDLLAAIDGEADDE